MGQTPSVSLEVSDELEFYRSLARKFHSEYGDADDIVNKHKILVVKHMISRYNYPNEVQRRPTDFASHPFKAAHSFSRNIPFQATSLQRQFWLLACDNDSVGLEDQITSCRGLVNSTCSPQGWTVLHIAAGCQASPPIMEALIKGGGDINMQDKLGWTPAMYAAKEGGDSMLNTLIRAGADLTIKDPKGTNALLAGAQHEDCVILILSANPPEHDINITDNRGFTPLMLAVLGNGTASASLLVSRGADVNATNTFNGTALHMAAWHGNIDIMELLLKHGARVDVEDAGGWTPLRYAEKNEDSAVKEALLSAAPAVQ